jgi:hypothetical protein
MLNSCSLVSIPAVVFVPLFALTTATTVLAQNLVVVGPAPGPGIDHTDLQSAVLAAGNDGTVIVKSGDYAGFFAGHKSLTLAAEAGAVVRVTSPSIVLHVQSNQRFVLRGLDFVGGGSSALQIADCAGPVWLEDCTVDHAGATMPFGFTVNDCASVALVRSRFHGPAGEPALRLYSEDVDPNHVYAFDSEFVGGTGLVGQPFGFQHGEAGVFVQDSTFYASGCTIRGGAGVLIPTSAIGCVQGMGGPGLRLDASEGVPHLYTLASSIQGGSGASGCGPAPIDGPALVGTFAGQTLAGGTRGLVADSPVREGQTLGLSFSGAPGELALVLAGTPSNAAFSGLPYLAPQLIGAPLQLLVAGSVPASGVLGLALTIAELGVGIEALGLHMQPAFIDTLAQSGQLGTPSHIVLVDAAF